MTPMTYYKIAGLVMGVTWENPSGRLLYNLGHDCEILPRSLRAYEMYEEVPKQVDMTVCVKNITPFQETVKGKKLKQEICYEKDDCFILGFFIDFEHEDPGCSLRIKKDYSHVDMIPHRPEGETFDLYRIQYAFECRMLQFGNFVIHGAAIEYMHKGIIFSGLSGAGKSTQAHLWKKYRNALIINGDCPAIRRVNGQTMVCGTPWCGTSGENIDLEVPLLAIVMVKQATKNSIRKLQGNEKFLTVLSQIFRSNIDANTLDAAISNLSAVIDSFSVYELSCTKDESAVDILEQALEE